MQYLHRFSEFFLFVLVLTWVATLGSYSAQEELIKQAVNTGDVNSFLVAINIAATIGIFVWMVQWCCRTGKVFCVRQLEEFSALEFFSGKEFILRRHLVIGTGPEKIKYAAIRHPNGNIFCVTQPGKHHHVVHFMNKWGMAGIRTTRDQGFVTSLGRFVDRKEGLAIAKAQGQIIKKHPSENELYSEDMW